MSRKCKGEISAKLTDIRNRVGRLNQKPDTRRYDVLSDTELRLLIALYRKAKGCPSLADHAVLEDTESELISAIHLGDGFDLQPFNEARLCQKERDKLDELQNRIDTNL